MKRTVLVVFALIFLGFLVGSATGVLGKYQARSLVTKAQGEMRSLATRFSISTRPSSAPEGKASFRRGTPSPHIWHTWKMLQV